MKSLCSVIIACLMLVPFGVNAGEWVDTNKANCKIWKQSPDETVSWSGKCESGYASGSGTEIRYVNGKETERYEGQIEAGKKQGKGTFTLANGDKYKGDFVNDAMHGKGTFTTAKGNRYEGDFVDDAMHGKGTFTTAKGNRYDRGFC